MKRTFLDTALQIFMAIPAMAGAFLIANTDVVLQKMGFEFLIISSISGFIFTVRHRLWWLFAQYLIFMGFAVMGVYSRWSL